MQFQAELCQPLPELPLEPLGIRSVLKAHHKIVGISDDDHVAFCHFPAPDISPQVEYVMQIREDLSWQFLLKYFEIASIR
jgi:hypothetical protein